MKTYTILIASILLVASKAYAQNDTMYIMKNGVVINKQSVKPTDVDSIIFYKPQTPSGATVTDAEGNVYQTVTIGTQVWMKENLKVTKYNGGIAIPLVTDNTAWSNLTTPGYCWYNNDSATYAQTYGALYNWYTVETENLCPTGWHVPTDDEWTTLTNYLGGDSVAGGKLKETGTVHWESPNTGATNESGFTALPGGDRDSSYGGFLDVGLSGLWWSATGSGTDSAWLQVVIYYYGGVGRVNDYKRNGFSVRCVRD